MHRGIRKAYPMAAKKEEAANVMAFDALYTNNQIQKLKVLLPYIDPAMQKNMAVYIKYMELQYTKVESSSALHRTFHAKASGGLY